MPSNVLIIAWLATLLISVAGAATTYYIGRQDGMALCQGKVDKARAEEHERIAREGEKQALETAAREAANDEISQTIEALVSARPARPDCVGARFLQELGRIR